MGAAKPICVNSNKIQLIMSKLLVCNKNKIKFEIKHFAIFNNQFRNSRQY